MKINKIIIGGMVKIHKFNNELETRDIFKQLDGFQLLFSKKMIQNSLIISIVLFPIGYLTKNSLVAFAFMIVFIYFIISVCFILPNLLINWYQARRVKSFYTWSRLRVNNSLSDFTIYFFNNTDQFDEAIIQENIDRDKQIVEHLQTFPKKDLEIGLALLTNSKLKNPIISFLTTSAVLTVLIQNSETILNI